MRGLNRLNFLNLKYIGCVSKMNIVIHHVAHSSANVLDTHRWYLKNGCSGF